MERLVSIDSLKIVPHDRRSLAALGMTWGVTKNFIMAGFIVQLPSNKDWHNQIFHYCHAEQHTALC